MRIQRIPATMDLGQLTLVQGRGKSIKTSTRNVTARPCCTEIGTAGGGTGVWDKEWRLKCPKRRVQRGEGLLDPRPRAYHFNLHLYLFSAYPVHSLEIAGLERGGRTLPTLHHHPYINTCTLPPCAPSVLQPSAHSCAPAHHIACTLPPKHLLSCTLLPSFLPPPCTPQLSPAPVRTSLPSVWPPRTPSPTTLSCYPPLGYLLPPLRTCLLQPLPLSHLLPLPPRSYLLLSLHPSAHPCSPAHYLHHHVSPSTRGPPCGSPASRCCHHQPKRHK